MNFNNIIKNVPNYCLIEKEITEKAILDDLIYGNKFSQISFSYKTETLIQFVYYCLNYFFKNKTHAESFHNIELEESNINNNNTSYLFKLKLILPNLLKLILKYLSINNSWFNFTFHGIELLDLIICFEFKSDKKNSFCSILNYLLNLKYRLCNDKINQNIYYSNWMYLVINEITDIISEIISSNLTLFSSTKDKIYNILGLIDKDEKTICQICKQFPTNSISFNCGHYFCYYCYFYNFMLLFPEKEINYCCFICNNL